MTTRTPVLEVKDLSVSFGDTPVLRDLSFSLNSGESLAITGPSGSGKTTLLSAIMGLVRPQSGQTVVDGQVVQELSRNQLAAMRGEKIGVVFQHSELIDSMSAIDNVALPALIRNSDDVYTRARDLLAAVAVPDRDTLAADLSGGERQRTAVARSLINSPALILADEPTGALDTDLQASIADLLYDLPRQNNCGLVIVTHDPKLADRADHRLHIRFSGVH